MMVSPLQVEANVQVWAKWQRGILKQHNAWSYGFNEKSHGKNCQPNPPITFKGHVRSFNN